MKELLARIMSELHLAERQLQKVVEEHGDALLQLQENEEKFRTIANYTYNWEYWLDSEGKFLYNSLSCEGLTGFSPDEFLSKPDLLLSIVHPADQDSFKEHQECACNTSRGAQHITVKIITKDGEERWIAHSCQPVHGSNGQFLGRRASNRNITQQKRIEEQLLLNEERFRLALDASSDGVWDRNFETDQEYYGANWHAVLGYTKDDAKNGLLTWKELGHPDDKIKATAAIQEHLDGLTPRFESEFRLRNKAGEWQWFLSRGKVIERSKTGKPLRLIGTHTDITKHKTIELELQGLKDELEKKVVERTKEMMEVNVALKVLLKKMEEDKLEFEQKVRDNITKLVDPYLEKLQNFKLSTQDRVVVDMLITNVHALTASFNHTVSTKMNSLTPSELQIANLVKNGKNTKEIAALMNLAPGTISVHRKKIRKKIGISNQKINLQTYLASNT